MGFDVVRLFAFLIRAMGTLGTGIGIGISTEKLKLLPAPNENPIEVPIVNEVL